VLVIIVFASFQFTGTLLKWRGVKFTDSAYRRRVLMKTMKVVEVMAAILAVFLVASCGGGGARRPAA
jgi:hypothetical protein